MFQGTLVQKPPRKHLLIFFCTPVSPGKSRLIVVGPRNYSLWIDPFLSRWMNHVMINLIVDSDMCLLRVQVKLSQP
ncbi:putative pheophorbide a oxygenase [Helianthus annuus]|nr:putative pheophorbide a oxygenase [Helianthus annuus]KAJ0686956.1 putative pheophorbide a oxygenase [Helianthus annuus]KAJ0690760.1 putative pheophorbide a oxygenase [Helianthus annuus]